MDRAKFFAYPSGVNSLLEIGEVADRLEEAFGTPGLDASDPVETLVATILSQNTNDRNRDRAYAALRASYSDWEAVRTAQPDELAAVIRTGGLHRQKAMHIQAALTRIHASGGDPSAFDLGFLAEMTTATALEWLMKLPGVGKKTAGIVLLFSFGKPYFPVDTHIARVTKRLRWIDPEQRDPHDALNDRITADPVLMRKLHLLLITLGREMCHPRHPACGVCPLIEGCPTGKRSQAEGKEVLVLPGEADG